MPSHGSEVSGCFALRSRSQHLIAKQFVKHANAPTVTIQYSAVGRGGVNIANSRLEIGMNSGQARLEIDINSGCGNGAKFSQK